MYNFACVCYGDKYPVEYVQKLYNMVTRNTTLHINFFVFTDHVKMEKMIDGNVNVRQFPENDLQGWWNKMQLFHPKTGLDGDTLYMDLDVVITQNIDCFFTHAKDKKVVLMRDFNRSTKGFNSSIMRFNNEVMTPNVWKPFLKERKTLQRLQGDQNVISQLIKQTPDKFDCFPDEWTFSAKWYDRDNPRFQRSRFTFERYPGAKVAVFHGKPDPNQLANPHPHESYDPKSIEWVKNHWK